MEPMTPPPPDDELPPPPTDIESEKQSFPPIKSRRPSAMAALRRASAIFEKDLRTMAKHGLVSAIILLVFLGIVFYIMSFAMQQSMMMRFDGGGDGGGDGGKNIGPLPGTTDRTPPVASMNVGASTILAGTTVQLDASGSTDDQGIIFYIWNFQDSTRDIELYGRTVPYTFAAAGKYNISLTVVDPAWNLVQANATLVVNHGGSDSESPNAMAGDSQNVPVGTVVGFNGSGSTDNVGVVNWTWTFMEYDWKIERVLYGPTPTYRFDNAGNYWVQLTVRDAAGNAAKGGTNVQVGSMGGFSPSVEIDAPQMVNVGDTVSLGAKLMQQNVSVQSFIWFIKQNDTTVMKTGSNTTFVATEQRVYSVVLAARDMFGNVGSSEAMVIVVPANINPNEITWESTPFGFEMPFNLLTYAYGIALLSSVIYVGGFFAKGFTHEISKGTIKVLFFGPRKSVV